MTISDGDIRLDTIRRLIRDDPSNTWAIAEGQKPLFTAAADARIVLIGQAPGQKAALAGKLWADPSGERLRSWLGVTEDEFYDPGIFALLPMDFFFLGKGKSGDLPPRKDFAPRWHPQILAELPKATLTLLVGSYAQKYYLKLSSGSSLTQTVHDYESFLPTRMPLVHPSPLNFRWQARNPWFETELLPVLRRTVRSALEGDADGR